jgi:hypothetical protein
MPVASSRASRPEQAGVDRGADHLHRRAIGPEGRHRPLGDRLRYAVNHRRSTQDRPERGRYRLPRRLVVADVDGRVTTTHDDGAAERVDQREVMDGGGQPFEVEDVRIDRRRASVGPDAPDRFAGADRPAGRGRLSRRPDHPGRAARRAEEQGAEGGESVECSARSETVTRHHGQDPDTRQHEPSVVLLCGGHDRDPEATRCERLELPRQEGLRRPAEADLEHVRRP